MTETDRVALVAVALACGMSLHEAWPLVDSLSDDLDVRAASYLVAEQAGATHSLI